MRTFDAILLLGVELDAQDKPTREMALRVSKAAQVFKDGAAPQIVCCGGICEGHAAAEADVMSAMLQEQGVSPDAILREDKSTDTMENFRFAARLLGGAKGKRVLVVTSDYHMLRSLFTARRVGFSAKGAAAALAHDGRWKSLRMQEWCYLLDLLMGWQDEGRSRPQAAMRLFDFVFHRK